MANRANVPWIFVSGHRPFYGSRDGQGGWDDHRKAIEPLLDEFDVDVYLAGHVHVFERSHGLMNYTVTDLPDADGNYRNMNGPLHITIGTAGGARWGAYAPPAVVPSALTLNERRPDPRAGLGCAHIAIVNDRWLEQPDWSAFRVRAYGFAEMTVANATAIQFQYRGSTVGPDFPKGVYPTTGLIDSFWLYK